MNNIIKDEISKFLKYKRSILNPADFGFSVGRRRGSGLRREEIAMLSGVSATWYTWLEQGRNIRISDFLIECIANVLKLNELEEDYLFNLIKNSQNPATPNHSNHLSSKTEKFINSIPHPAFIRNGLWDILYWNSESNVFIGKEHAAAEPPPNILRMIFFDEDHRSKILDWDKTAASVVSQFKRDFSRFANDHRYEDLLRELQSENVQFRLLWEQNTINEREDGIRKFLHPTYGVQEFERTCLTFEANDFLKLETYIKTST